MSYIIYKHTNKINGKSYIGQTIQKPSRRWRDGKHYIDQIFGVAIKKYGWDNFEHIILKDNIQTVEEANYWEEYYIKYYHTCIYDPNCNGYNVSWGGYNRDNYGKAVLQLDINKNILAEFVSVSDAARSVNTSPDQISRCCNHSDTHHEAAGYFWCFKEDYNNYSVNKVTNKKVYQLDINKNILNIFDSIADAGRYLHKPPNNNNISLCLAGKKLSAYGYYWCLAEEYDTFTIVKSPLHTLIYCVELDNTFVGLRVASEATGADKSSILRCCKGIQKTAKGYHWEYA